MQQSRLSGQIYRGTGAGRLIGPQWFMPDPIKQGLEPEVLAAWRAYGAMGHSKKNYFSLLQELDEKYKHGGSPGIAENLRLEKLLSEHDQKVKQFNQAMAGVTEPDARERLLALLSSDTDESNGH